MIPTRAERSIKKSPKAAAGSHIALPLLQDALSELYQKRDGRRNLLTLEAYDELGGLEGAIGRRAGKTVADLPPEVRANLPDVMRRLAVLREGSEETFTAARAEVAQVASTPQRRALVDALVEARLLVMDKTESGATVGFAHEALLKYWPRLKQLLEEDREFCERDSESSRRRSVGAKNARILTTFSQPENLWRRGVIYFFAARMTSTKSRWVLSRIRFCVTSRLAADA